jgi:hypothetical protein
MRMEEKIDKMMIEESPRSKNIETLLLSKKDSIQ